MSIVPRSWQVLAALAVSAVLLAGGCTRSNPADEAAYKRAIRDIKSTDQNERATAAENLKRWPKHAKESIPLLIDALKDNYSWVPIFSAGSLTSLTGVDFAAEGNQLSHERWNKWWNQEVKHRVPDVEPSDKRDLERLRARVENDKGLMHLNGGDYISAANMFMSAIKLDSKTAKYHSNLGLALLGLQQYDRALKCFDAAMTIDPTFCESYLNKGEVYSDKAANLRAAAMEHERSMSAAKAAGEGGIFERERGKLRECLEAAETLEAQALDEFQHAIAADVKEQKEGRLWAAHASIGRIWMRQAQWDQDVSKRTAKWEKAVGPLEKARDYSKTEISIRRDLAITYFALDQYFRAWKEIKAIDGLGGTVDAGFRKKVEDQVRAMGVDPGSARPDSDVRK